MNIGQYLIPQTKSRRVFYYPPRQFATIEENLKSKKSGKPNFWSIFATMLPVRQVLRNLSLKNPLGINTFSKNYVEFPNVRSIDLKFVKEVAEVSGLTRFDLVPWYTKAINLTISGYYYFGAISDEIDITAKDLFYKKIKGYILEDDQNLNAPNVEKKLRSLICIGDYESFNSINVVGIIKQFDIKEVVEQQFTFDYTLTFVGIEFDNYIQMTK